MTRCYDTSSDVEKSRGSIASPLANLAVSLPADSEVQLDLPLRRTKVDSNRATMRFDTTIGSLPKNRGDWLSCYDATLALNPVTECISGQSPSNARQRSNLCGQPYRFWRALSFSLFVFPPLRWRNIYIYIYFASSKQVPIGFSRVDRAGYRFTGT